jgi:hypothetical protein
MEWEQEINIERKRWKNNYLYPFARFLRGTATGSVGSGSGELLHSVLSTSDSFPKLNSASV